MVNHTDDAFVREVQKRLADAGHYDGKVDGIAGPGTLKALDKALPKMIVISVPMPGPVDTDNSLPAASKGKLYGVNETLVQLVNAASKKLPGRFIVIEGLRSKERQAEMVKKGASKTTNSRHLTGHAVDLWPLDETGKVRKAGTPVLEALLWKDLREIATVMKDTAKELGIQVEWGGDWGWDGPHFQLNRKKYPA